MIIIHRVVSFTLVMNIKCILCPMIPLFKYTELQYHWILGCLFLWEASNMVFIGRRTTSAPVTIQSGTYTGKRLSILCTCFGRRLLMALLCLEKGEFMRDTFILSRRPMTQLPKLYNCTPPNCAHGGGYIIPTLEVYFDRPHNVNDTFFVGNTAFLTSYGKYAYNCFYSVPADTRIVYLRDYASSFNGLFRSDNGNFRPFQNCGYPVEDPRMWPQTRYPGLIDNTYRSNAWGGPMAIVAPPCMVPNELRMTQVGYDSATVEWDIPVGVSHCRLEYGPQGFASGTGTIVDSLTEGRYCMHNLDENMAYEVRVACWCIYAEEYSDTVSVGFRTAYACPPVPAVTGCAVTDTTIALSWWIPDSANYTDIEYGPAGFAQGEGTSKPHITRNYYGYGTLMMSGLEPRTAYEVRMRNYCSHSDAMSEWFSFDTMTTWTDTTTEGLNAVLQEQVSLRPNPATTRVQVASPVAMTRIVVTDLQGRTLLELPVTADTAEFDTSTWPRGTVIVTIHIAQGKAVKKLALK